MLVAVAIAIGSSIATKSWQRFSIQRATRAPEFLTVNPMLPIDPHAARGLLEAFIAAFAVLGGVMAYFSGLEASSALAQDLPPPIVAQRINEGVGQGFEVGAPAAVIALMIMGWSS